MKNKINSGFFAVSVIIGFMLAIQFQAVQEPEVRDTRDTWELKADLLTEQKQQEELLEEIKSLEDQLARYQTERSSSKERALKDTLEKLKEEAGLTDVTGQGLVLTINPLPDDLLLNKPVEQISPALLKRLINELNKYDAEQISVNEERIINSTVIREVNGITKIDGVSLNTFPIEIKVIAADKDKLGDRLKASQVLEELFMENLFLDISKPDSSITIPAYRNAIQVDNMSPVIQGKEEDG